MIDVEPLIVRELDALVPLPAGGRADWGDVQRRAGVAPRGRRRLVLAIAVALTAVVAAVAVAKTLGGFSAWLTGEPGKPASPAEQRAFDRATRSWFGFPHGTGLRRLAETRAGASTFTLYGFRSAGSLCLRVVAHGPAHGEELSCAPLSELRARKEPALVVSADYRFGIDKARRTRIGPDVYLASRATVTIGIVADGVDRVELASDRGRVRTALVASNAFIDVVDRPQVGVTTSRVWAVAGKRRVEIPFAQTPFGFWGIRFGTSRPARGPATVERKVHGGAIRWLARRELRGEPVPANLRLVLNRHGFRRMVRPDPRFSTRLVVSVGPAGTRFPKARLNRRQVCWELLVRASSAGSCVPAGQMFSTAPFTWMVSGDSSQYVTLTGLASDAVGRMELFLATGERRPVPMHDNAYVVEASRAKYPLRLVAYDAADRVIGVTTLKGDAAALSVLRPVDNPHWRRLIRVEGATLWVAPAQGGGRCFALSIGPLGGGMRGCRPDQRWTGPPLQLGVSMLGEGRAWVSGRVRADVAAVAIGAKRVRPVEGFVLALVRPQRPLRATALAADGRVLGKATILR